MTVHPSTQGLEFEALEALIDFTIGGALTPNSVNLPDGVLEMNISSPWEYAHYVAINQWLTEYEPTGDSPLEQVRGWLEAFYHTCQVEIWPIAQAIAEIPSSTGQPLYKQLGKWGYLQEQVELCQTLLNHVDPKFEQYLHQLAGDGLRHLGNQLKAKEHYEKLLALGQTQLNPEAELHAHCGLAHLAAGLTKYHQAIVQFQQVLPLARQLSAWEKVAEILQQLALSYIYLGRTQKGFNLLQEAMVIAQTHHLTTQEILILQNLANAHEWNGESSKALPYLNQCLEISQKQNNLRMQATSLIGISRYHFSIKEHEKAIELSRQSLSLHQEIHCLPGCLMTLNDLGVFFAYGLNQMTDALPYFEEAESLARRLGEQGIVAMLTAHKAYCYAALGQSSQAEENIQVALNTIQSSDEKNYKVVVYGCLAKVQWEQGYYWKALALVTRYLLLAPPWNTINGRLLLNKAWETVVFTFTRKVKAVQAYWAAKTTSL